MRCSTLLAGLLSTLLVSATASWGASQPGIEIVLGDRTVMLARSELLQRADLTEVRIPRDPTYVAMALARFSEIGSPSIV
jgi:hypothetical protein